LSENAKPKNRFSSLLITHELVHIYQRVVSLAPNIFSAYM